MYKIIADLHTDAGINARSSFDAMRMAAGGTQNLEFTHQDLRNHIRTRRETQMEGGAVEFLMDHFLKEANKNIGNYSKIKIDKEDNQIESIFWADAQMRMDYQCFGDCFSFDTTYRTNNHHRPLAIFVGKTHHNKMCVFGSALLYDETTKTFEWLFETFLECMNWNAPTSIFTDQCAAIAAAVKTKFPRTFHGLCTFHILHNGPRNLGKLYNHEFRELLKFVMYNVENQSEFEEHWKILLETCPRTKGNWTNSLYKLKEKWSSAWIRNQFCAGMKTSQMSETCNSNLRLYLSSTTNLPRLVCPSI
ncbi:Protein FAR1-RELATED SEQUENCE 5 [Linum perenne]